VNVCVIFVCRERLPSEDELRQAWMRNSDGAGVAWWDGGKVKWRKGLMRLSDLLELLPQLKLPCIIHLRAATHGGITPELTHPFIISTTRPYSLELRGALRKGEALLFHNGVEHNALPQLVQLLVLKGQRLDTAHMSDSRAIAILASMVGTVALSLFNSKFAVIDWKGDVEVRGHFYEEDGLLVSSHYKWDYRQTYKGYGQYGWGCGLADGDEWLKRRFEL
jgi:glutamine phosphoribosylpyrophosphate amidotransferase